MIQHGRQRHIKTLILTITCTASLATLWATPRAALAAGGGGEETSKESLDSRPDLTRGKERKALQRQGDHVTDAKGRRVRVAFPLYDRVVVESAGRLSATTRDAQGEGLTTRTPFGVGFAWYRSLALDFNDEDIWWMLRHKLLATDYREVSPDGGARLRVAALQGQYLRHDLSSFVVVPRGEDDLRLPANFDIAADYRLMEVEGVNEDLFAPRAGFRLTRVETLSVALLMDFVRDESYRRRFAVGVAGWHTMWRADAAQGWRHELSPLSSLKVLYGVDHSRGLVRSYGEVACGGVIGLEADEEQGMGGAWAWRCRALHELEWVFMSVNDHPVSVPLEVRVDMPLARSERGVVEATLGLRVGFVR